MDNNFENTPDILEKTDSDNQNKQSSQNQTYTDPNAGYQYNSGYHYYQGDNGSKSDDFGRLGADNSCVDDSMCRSGAVSCVGIWKEWKCKQKKFLPGVADHLCSRICAEFYTLCYSRSFRGNYDPGIWSLLDNGEQRKFLKRSSASEGKSLTEAELLLCSPIS